MNYVFVVGENEHAARWIPNMQITYSFQEADLVLFTGGADVSPALYHQKKNKRTVTSPGRDAKEIRYFLSALHTGKKMLGICRGAQLLTVLSGGTLFQHVTNHALQTNHRIIDANNPSRDIWMSSTHHQMMNPYCLPDADYQLIAYTEKLSDKFKAHSEKELNISPDFKEPEVMYYPKTDALCIQGHPEYLILASKGVKYSQELVTNLMNDNI